MYLHCIGPLRTEPLTLPVEEPTTLPSITTPELKESNALLAIDESVLERTDILGEGESRIHSRQSSFTSRLGESACPVDL